MRTLQRRGLRRAIWPLLCCALLATGCPVIEVVNDIGKDTKPKPAAKAKQPAPGKPGLPPAPDGSARAKLREYYNRRPAAPVEEDPDNPIVGCRLSSGTQFMRKHDCTLRGGRAVS